MQSAQTFAVHEREQTRIIVTMRTQRVGTILRGNHADFVEQIRGDPLRVLGDLRRSAPFRIAYSARDASTLSVHRNQAVQVG